MKYRESVLNTLGEVISSGYIKGNGYVLVNDFRKSVFGLGRRNISAGMQELGFLKMRVYLKDSRKQVYAYLGLVKK